MTTSPQGEKQRLLQHCDSPMQKSKINLLHISIASLHSKHHIAELPLMGRARTRFVDSLAIHTATKRV